MRELVMPEGDSRDGRVRMRAWQPSVAPECWLHSETAAELRAQRSLPTPRVTLPPGGQTNPRLAAAARVEKAGGAAAGRYLLTSMLAILLGVLVGSVAAVLLFAASAPVPGR